MNVDQAWADMTDSERISALLALIDRLSVVTFRLIDQVVELEDRVHTLELSSDV